MTFFIIRRKFLTRISFLLIILGSVHYLLEKQSWIKELAIFHRSSKTSWFHRGYGACNPAKNIAYLKTHKCSSSAFQNILFRYGLDHELIFAIPETGNYFGRFIPFHSTMVPKRLRDAFKLNILALHTIWNHEEVKSVMPPDTVYFTSIREPTAIFESLYSYAMEKSLITPLDEYVKNTEITDPRVDGHIGYNQMCFDFGVEMNKIQNLTYVKEKIAEADKNFDLVLVTERMEESLVLLKHLLCWSLEDVVTLKLNARLETFKSVMKNDTRKLLEMRQIPDRFLYDHFYEKFDKLVKEFGEEKMAREVQELRVATKKKIKECGFKKQDYKHLRGRHKVFNSKVNGYTSDTKSSDCLNIVSGELFLINQIRNIQRLKIIRKSGQNPSSALLENLPLGAVALDNKNLNETSELLKKYLLHS